MMKFSISYLFVWWFVVCLVTCNSVANGQENGQPIEEAYSNEQWTEPPRTLGKFVHVNLPKADSPGFVGVRCKSLLADSFGNIWYVTYSGLTRWNTKTDHWLRYDELQGHSPTSILTLFEDSSGRIWVGLISGVLVFHPNLGTWGSFTTEDGLDGNQFKEFTEDKSGAVYVRSSTALCLFKEDKKRWNVVPKKEEEPSFVKSSSRNTLYLPNGEKWKLRFGVVDRFEKSGELIESYHERNQLRTSQNLCLYLDSNNVVNIGCNAGISRFDQKTGKWEHWGTDQGLVHKVVWNISEDKNGTLWIGTEGGLCHYQPQTDQWKAFGEATGLKGHTVLAVGETDEGLLWVGNHNSNPSRLNPTTGSWQSLTPPHGPFDSQTRDFLADSQGNLWFSSSSGITRYDKQNDKWEQVNNGIGHPWVWSFYESPDQSLWCGGVWGAARFNTKTKSWQKFPVAPTKLVNGVSAIIQGPDGKMWFGQASAIRKDGGGISIVDPKSRKLTAISLKQGLSSSNVYDFHLDNRGRVLAATGAGANLLEKDEDGEWQVTWIKDEGPDGRTQTIVKDSAGLLWFGTDKIPVVFDVDKDTWQEMPGMNGMLPRICDSKGQLWLSSGPLLLCLQRQGPYAGSLLRYTPTKFHRRYGAVGKSLYAITRPGGLCLSDPKTDDAKFINEPAGATVSCLEAGPEDSFWVGYESAGLQLVSKEKTWRLPPAKKTPWMAINAIAINPQTDRQEVWMATEAGACLIRRSENKLEFVKRVENRALPQGPVNSITCDSKGNLFLAFNKIPTEYFADADLAKQRLQTQVWRVTPDGNATRLTEGKDFLADSIVRSIACSREDDLWVATNKGLFIADSRVGENVKFRERRYLKDLPIHEMSQNKPGKFLLIVHDTESNLRNPSRLLVSAEQRGNDIRFSNLNTHLGLSNETVRSAAGDSKGNLLLGIGNSNWITKRRR